MLDKNLPYMDIIMKAPKEVASVQPISQLPEGYSYHMYKAGDEIAWAELETSVEEFESFEDALTYFNRVFMPYQDILQERMCFIKDENGNFVSTATAWFKQDEKKRYALLHWVSTAPQKQGLGLASAIVKYALSRFNEVEPDESEIFLHTQTWSYKAIGLYYKYGFKITKDALLDCSTNMECISILEKELPKEMMKDIIAE